MDQCFPHCSRIENLGVKKSGRIILRDVNFHLHCGELTVLIGPNGAGKTTLLRSILGEIPHTGNIIFSTAHNRPLIGYVPQRLEFDLGSPLSVLDLFTASLSSFPSWLIHPKSVKSRAASVLSRVQAEHLVTRKLGNLSGGELQRVLLALALEPSPLLLLMDEPVSGIDKKGLALFYELVSELRSKWDMAILLVSHDLDLASKYADKLIFLNQTIIGIGPPDTVMSRDEVRDTFALDRHRRDKIC